jgi:hypothetical protein
VWMACVNNELARQLKATVVLDAGKPVCVPAEGSWTVGNCKEGTMYYYGTLGYVTHNPDTHPLTLPRCIVVVP